MNKKSGFWAFAMALMLIGLAGCADDDIAKGSLMKPGQEIIFGASLPDEEKTRTYYGEEEELPGGGKVWPIYWNYEAGQLDQIFVSSPQAMEGRNQATYTVNADTEKMSRAASITKTGEIGIQAGNTAEPHNFYGMYPASSIIKMEGTTVSATLSSQQRVDVDKTMAGENGTTIYTTTPDMKYCLMTCKKEDVTLKEDEAVNLQFEPFSSVLNITVNGPKEENYNMKESIVITSVEILANAEIAGYFTYDYVSGEFTFASEGDEEHHSYKNILIYTVKTNEDGIRGGVPLKKDDKLTLQAFILPNPAVTSITVKIHDQDSHVWTKSLNITETNFQARKIHPVNLPNIQDPYVFDYSIWLSQMDENIYLSEVSLPGSCISFTGRMNPTSTEGKNQQVQKLRLAEQFKAGIRVFQGHTWLYPGTGLDGTDGGYIGINVNGHGETVNSAGPIIKLSEVLDILQEEMRESHGDEFCVLLLSAYQEGDTYDYPTYNARFRQILQYLEEQGMVASNIGPNTTIADVKNKIIIKYAFDGNITDTNELLAKIKNWTIFDGASILCNWWVGSAGSSLQYAPMYFKNVGQFNYTPATYAILAKKAKTAVLNSIDAPGLATLAVTYAINSQERYWNWTRYEYRSSVDVLTAEPSAADLASPDKMWYIYTEQANAGAYYNKAIDNINKVVDIIPTKYQHDTHNTFFMTYAGGTGNKSENGNSGYSVETIAQDFAGRWIERIDAGDFSQTPYGWVLFNDVKMNPNTEESKNDKVIQAIQKIIEHNNTYILKRNTVHSTSNGNVQSIEKGGSLF